MFIFSLKKMAQERNLLFKKNFAYGETEDYLFTLATSGGYVLFFIPLTDVGDQVKERILQFFKENKRKLKIMQYGFDNAVLSIKMGEYNQKKTTGMIDNVFNCITGILRENNVQNKRSCIFCGKEGASEKVYIDGICYYAHGECFTAASKDTEEAVQEYNYENKNYIPGFIGALIGGIICTIPWILTQVFLERIAAVLAYLIGVGALKGYTIFKGKMGRATRWIVTVTTFISVVFAEFGILIAEFIREDIPVNMDSINIALSIDEIKRNMIANLALGLLMACVGIFPLFRGLKGDAKSVLPKIQKNLEE